MKKYSDDPIPQIVDYGDGRYEFCFNQSTETTEREGEVHTSYVCDIVICAGTTPDKSVIKEALIADGKTDAEAEELLANFSAE